jgi:AraC-like DNA-binding protein
MVAGLLSRTPGPPPECETKPNFVANMSPLQFQKHLRLQEARRLLLAGDVDAARAGYRVGYEEASHFSREYKKLFGEPPRRDVERLRGEAASRLELAPV